jgi:hypothetical protein
MEKSPSLEVNRSSAGQEVSWYFIEHEGSLPHSQMPATCPYLEPDR